MITAKVVADSVNPSGSRITTFVLTYPRFIHSEFMTHRMISRNASSSRAIPVKKQIQMVLDNPVVPLAFTRNKKGMQGGEALDESASKAAEYAWLTAMGYAVKYAQLLCDLDVHKQYANRILEPYAHITVVATATDWDNFFALRMHPAAQPEINALAHAMFAEMQASKPQELSLGKWHLPFVDAQAMQEIKDYCGVSCLQDKQEAVDLAILRSVARCARVSYLNHDGTASTIADDSKLFTQLIGGSPIHASPAEHQAQSADFVNHLGNFKGWVQYRKTLNNENILKFEPGMFDAK